MAKIIGKAVIVILPSIAISVLLAYAMAGLHDKIHTILLFVVVIAAMLPFAYGLALIIDKLD